MQAERPRPYVVVRYVVDEWHQQNPGAEIPDGLILTQLLYTGPNSCPRDQVIYYLNKHDRARP